MKALSKWKNRSNGQILQYDFEFSQTLNEMQKMVELKKVVDALESLETEEPTKVNSGWLALAKQIPKDLRRVLVNELIAGNQILGVGRSGWPNQDSVVVNLAERFISEKQLYPATVTWRKLEDPHYWREELSQRENGSEHLLIA